MSERRRPDRTIRISSPSGTEKYELFTSSQFTSARWVNQPRHDAEGHPTYRVRYNGAWLPREPVLLPIADVMDLIYSRVKSEEKL